MENYIYTIDVAHPPLKPATVEKMLLDALLHVRNHPHLRVIKVIHGYGSSGRGGQTRETVRNWAHCNKKHILETIHGEEFNTFDVQTQSMRDECGIITDNGLGKGNPGVTLFWIK